MKLKSLKFREIGLIAMIVGLLIMGGLFVGNHIKTAQLDPRVVMAAVTNPSTASPGYMMVNLPIIATLTTGTTNNIVRFKMPWPATLLGVSGVYRAAVGANLWTVDVLEAGSSVLTVPLVINSTSVTEGVISDSTIADEATIGIRLVGTGNSIYDPTVQLIFKRK
jgi:hypothetical protein